MTWNIRIGINPISWSNDDLPSLGGETPLEVALTEGVRYYTGYIPSPKSRVRAFVDADQCATEMIGHDL